MYVAIIAAFVGSFTQSAVERAIARVRANAAMRHYYDVYSLLKRADVQAFIGTADYAAHKQKRFRAGDNPNIAQNEAFLLSDPETHKLYEKAFVESSSLYYGEIPTLGQILEETGKWAARL